MFVSDAKLLGLKRKCSSREIIGFGAPSHHAMVDYYTVTASPVMFYSLRVTLRGRNAHSPTSYLAFESNPYPQLYVKTQTSTAFIPTSPKQRFCVFIRLEFPSHPTTLSQTSNYFINRSQCTITAQKAPVQTHCYHHMLG